jgi:hypothetical protein
MVVQQLMKSLTKKILSETGFETLKIYTGAAEYG